MSNITGAFILPHPPIMIKEVGGPDTSKVENTINAALETALRIKAMNPDTIVIISPHGPLFSDAISINMDKQMSGSFKSFGAPQVKLDFINDIPLAEKIIEIAAKTNVLCIPLNDHARLTYRLPRELDHGALVPLYFINKELSTFKLVHITYSLLPNEDHYRLGIAIKKAAQELNRNIVVIASGDLSHRLTKDAPAGFDPQGAVFDSWFVEQIEKGAVKELLMAEHELTEAAGECGYRSTVILLGCLDGTEVKGEVLSYEGPFGVGYCIAQLHTEGTCQTDVLGNFMLNKQRQLKEIRDKEDPYVRLARKTLEAYINGESEMALPADLPDEILSNQAGVFVSIKKNGELRGCIGTISPVKESIASEIIHNAISAGTRDPRFSEIEAHELRDLVYSVDVLGEPEPVQSKDQLDVIRYGVIVTAGHRSGLLLPNLEGVNTVEEQLSIALRKAGIGEHEKYSIHRFEVIRHH